MLSYYIKLCVCVLQSLAKSREVLAVLRSKDNVQSKSKAKSLKPTSKQEINARINSLSLFISSLAEKLLPGQRDMLNSDLQRVLGHPLTDTGTQEASQLPPITPQAMYVVHTWVLYMAPSFCLLQATI